MRHVSRIFLPKENHFNITFFQRSSRGYIIYDGSVYRDEPLVPLVGVCCRSVDEAVVVDMKGRWVEDSDAVR